MASYADIDKLVEWVGSEQIEKPWAAIDPPQGCADPDAAVPVRRTAVAGDLSEAGSRSEMEMKVLLWAVQRLIGGLSTIGAERDIASRLHVVLPGSPNPRHVRWRRRLRRVQVRARRVGEPLERRSFVGRAGHAWRMR